jgi:chemotaxis protein CheC
MQPTDMHLDAVRETINMGMGHAAGVLNRACGMRFRLHVPVVQIAARFRFNNKETVEYGRPMRVVVQEFTGTVCGFSALAFSEKTAERLVAAVTRNISNSVVNPALTEAAVVELGNITLSGVTSRIGDILQFRFRYQPPVLYPETALRLMTERLSGAGDPAVIAHAKFSIVEKEDGAAVYLFFKAVSPTQFLIAVDRIRKSTET